MGLKRVTWGQNNVSAFRPTGCRVTVKHVSYSGPLREQKEEEEKEEEKEDEDEGERKKENKRNISRTLEPGN